MELVLPARRPFNLASVVNSHGWVQLAPFEKEDGLVGFRYVTQLSTGRVVDIRVGEAETGVKVTVADGLSNAERAEVERTVAWMLGLDQDFTSFYEAARSEPKLARAPERAQGRILRSASVFEDAVRTILTVNTSWAGTKRMVSRLVSLYGSLLVGDDERRAFPIPARLAALDETALRVDAKLGFRAPSVLALARSVASGAVDLEALTSPDLPTPEVRKRLLSIRGVGPYAAANLLMLLGHYDFVPVDSWAMTMVSREFYQGRPAGQSEVEATFARWGKWQGLAYWFWDWGQQ